MKTIDRTDIVAEIVSLVREKADIRPEQAAIIENEIRSRYAGQRVDVLRQPPVTLERINHELRQGRSVTYISDHFGVSRATIYRRLSDNSFKNKQN